ncbi:MAG: DNA/RNA nuclease SfsA [Lagierella massiliensis]|nr:DNA/RNA nuclease SfsA [Lagierella massiliensis]
MYQNIYKGIFVRRLNRFLALIFVENKLNLVHIKNTSRCKEIFQPGVLCYVQKTNNPNRKTKYTLISALKFNKLINLDSVITNDLVYKGLVEKYILSELNPINIKREVKYLTSRFDISFYSQKYKKDYFLEVKGVSLESNGIAAFPGAPTKRGTKHLEELIQAVKDGYGAIIIFVIQLKEVSLLVPHFKMDPLFSNLLIKAYEHGVMVKAYNSIVTRNNIELYKEIEVSFDEKYSNNFRI